MNRTNVNTKWGATLLVVFGAALVYGNGKTPSPRIANLLVQPSGVTITWASDALATQQVERTESLTAPQIWESIHEVLPGGAPWTNQFLDDEMPGGPAVFYRILESN